MKATIYDTTQVTSKENGSNPRPGDPCHPLTAKGHIPLLILDDQGGVVMNIYKNEVTGTLRAQVHGHQQIVLHQWRMIE